VEGPGSSNWKKFSKLGSNRKTFQRGAKNIEKATLRHAHRFIISRFQNIKEVRRFAFGWIAAVSLLIVLSVIQLNGLQNSYSSSAASDGGIYAEGVIGQLDVINPLFAATASERAASKLIFSGLLSYDSTGALKGELAQSWRVEREGSRYVIELRPNLKWHDGTTLTADDIVFTVQRMQNPAVRAQQLQSWSNVKVSKLSSQTIAFDLPRPYAAFPHALTFGILPKHVFKDIEPELLRETELNNEPIGSGPFVFARKQIIDPDADRVVVYMNQNETYVQGPPRLERFQLHTFAGSNELQEAFVDREVNAAAGMTTAALREAATTRQNSTVFENGVDDGVYAFMNQDSEILKDKKVRQALLYSFDRDSLKKSLSTYALPLGGPLMNDQTGNTSTQLDAEFDIQKAERLLDDAGWKKNTDGERVKNGTPLTVRLVGIDAGDYPVIVEQLDKQWSAVGVDVQTQLSDPDIAQQNVIVPRAYDVLVYELEIGSDPDVFAFWHKSQAGPRGLNLSNYKSDIASETLETAQERFEPKLRKLKYEAFTDVWVKDIPAIALYQPEIGYIVSENTSALQSESSLPTRIDRYVDVHQWTINQNNYYQSR